MSFSVNKGTIKLLKIKFCIVSMEQSANTYTCIQEKSEIFEYVNNVHLHLKGNIKKQTKRKFVHTWKQNNTSPGCFELFIALYKSHDTYDKDNEWFRKHLKANCETEGDYNTRKISLAKHRRIVGRRQEEIDEFERQLEELEEAKGYIKEEEHIEMMRDQKKSLKRDAEDMEDSYIKKLNQVTAERDKALSQLNIQIAQNEYLKDAIKQYETKD